MVRPQYPQGSPSADPPILLGIPPPDGVHEFTSRSSCQCFMMPSEMKVHASFDRTASQFTTVYRFIVDIRLAHRAGTVGSPLATYPLPHPLTKAYNVILYLRS